MMPMAATTSSRMATHNAINTPARGKYSTAMPIVAEPKAKMKTPAMMTVTDSSTRRVCFGIGTDGFVYQFGYGRSAAKLGGKGDTFCSVATVDQTGKLLIAARDFDTHTPPNRQGRVAVYDRKSNTWTDAEGEISEKRFQSVAVVLDENYQYQFAGSDENSVLCRYESNPKYKDWISLMPGAESQLPQVCWRAQAGLAALDEYGHVWCSRNPVSVHVPAFSCNIRGQSALGDLWFVPGGTGASGMAAGWTENRSNYDLYDLYAYVFRPPGGAGPGKPYQVALRFHEGGIWNGPYGITVMEEDVLEQKPAWRLNVTRYTALQPQLFDLVIQDGFKVTGDQFQARLLHRSSGRFLSTRPLDDASNTAVLRAGGQLDATVLSFIRE